MAAARIRQAVVLYSNNCIGIVYWNRSDCNIKIKNLCCTTFHGN